MLTVEQLLARVRPRAARRARRPARRRVRWVHCTELLDPTPWLTGGELLLTTGIQLADPRAPARVRRAARRARDRRRSASAPASRTSALPDALLAGRARAVAAAVRGALRAAVHRDLRARVRASRRPSGYAALRRSTAIQEQLERLVLEERGIDEVMAVVAEAIGGTRDRAQPARRDDRRRARDGRCASRARCATRAPRRCGRRFGRSP